MNLDSLMQGVLEFISTHPYATGGILAVVGLLAYFKLKLVLKVVSACLILGAIAYVVLFIFNLASTGVENTEKFLDHPNQAIER